MIEDIDYVEKYNLTSEDVENLSNLTQDVITGKKINIRSYNLSNNARNCLIKTLVKIFKCPNHNE
ncbi:MAG: hypothetical protein KAS32_02250 [Candidatus Peribacteraceae bacterium]|nr:hypothetical protein [Candidatus Peribacteraceae bacterium]